MEKEEKKVILDEVAKLAFGFNDMQPQIVDGKVSYYLSGSVAMFVLANAESVTPMILDSEGNILSVGEEIKFDDKNREAIEQGARLLGSDIDVVETKGGNAPPDNLFKIKQMGVDVEKCFKGKMIFFDVLSEERTFKTHHVALVKSKDGRQIIICHPFLLLVHKAQETLFLIHKRGVDDPKTQKDLQDFACLYHAIVGTELFPEKPRAIIENLVKEGASFSAKKLTDEQYNESLITFIEVVHPLIDDKVEVRVYDFVESLKAVKEPIKEDSKEK